MKRTIALLFCAALFAAVPTNAQIASHSRDIVVLLPGSLPEIAQVPGESMALHSVGNGSIYLYIEQQQMGRLAILDVSNLTQVKAVGIAPLKTDAPFSFAMALGDSAELVCFPGRQAAAILDLHHPQQPRLVSIDGLHHVTNTESLGSSGFLIANGSEDGTASMAVDYQILDASNQGSPRLLATVPKVHQRVKSQLNGAVYLLGSDGLTIIRRPRVEEEYNIEVTRTNELSR
jgi:hypothetical protein